MASCLKTSIFRTDFATLGRKDKSNKNFVAENKLVFSRPFQTSELTDLSMLDPVDLIYLGHI